LKSEWYFREVKHANRTHNSYRWLAAQELPVVWICGLAGMAGGMFVRVKIGDDDGDICVDDG
jgi:hypothetical protein